VSERGDNLGEFIGEHFGPGFLSQFGSGRSAIDAIRGQGRDQDTYVQDTRIARVIASDEDIHTADVVVLENEICLAHQERVNDPLVMTDYFTLDANAANSPRHMAWRFTAGHAAIPHFLELQLKTQTVPDVIGTGRIWVAIYQDDGTGTAPGALLVTMNSRVGPRLPSSTWSLAFFFADWEANLVGGTQYWIAICTANPMTGADAWGATDLWVRRREEAFADPTVMDTASNDYPLGGAYSSHVDRRPWFQLHQCEHTLRGVPMAENAPAPSAGELVTMRRVQGMHPQREIIGPLAGQTAGRVTSSAVTGGAGSFQLFTPGSIPFAGTSGILTEDNPNLFWDDTNNRLGIGTLAPGYPLHVVGAGRFDQVYAPQVGPVGDPDLLVLAADLLTVNGDAYVTSAAPHAWVYNTSAGGAAITRTMTGLRLSAGGMNTTSKYTPGVLFMSTDAEFTTENPKLLAGIWGEAIEAYTFDNRGGMRLVFGTTPATPGVNSVPTIGMALLSTGDLAINAGKHLHLDGYTGAGDTYICESVADVIACVAGGNDQFDVEVDHVWVDPTAYVLAVEGDLSQCSVHKTLRWYMGGMQQLGASLLDTALVADVTVTSVAGTLAETEVTSKSVDTTFCVIGNSVKCFVTGSAILHPRGSAGNSTMHIIFRIEGTNVLDLPFSAVYGEGPTWINFEFEFIATIRSNVSWMIGNVKGRCFDSSEPGDPRPNQTLWTEEWYRMTAPFVVAGDVATSVRCSIANSTAAESTCTVHQHQFGLEQT
jgi:hypothetical protein